MVKETKSSETARSEFLKALAVFEEKQKKDFVLTEYKYEEVSGYVVEREYAFYTHAQFLSTFGDPSLLALTPDTLHDEKGQKMTAYVVCRDDKPLTIKVQHSLSGWHSSLLQPASEQLRPAQSKSFKQVYEEDAMRMRPKTMQNPMKGLLHSNLRDRLAAEKVEKEKKEGEARQLKELLPATQQMEEVKKEEEKAEAPEEDEDEEEVDQDVVSKPAVLQSELARMGQTKGRKGQGKGNSKDVKAKAKAKATTKGKATESRWRLCGKASLHAPLGPPPAPSAPSEGRSSRSDPAEGGDGDADAQSVASARSRRSSVSEKKRTGGLARTCSRRPPSG